MNVIGASILIVLVAAVLTSSRRWALLAMVGGALYLTQSQAVVLLGFNMFAVRFLEVAGFARVIVRREFSFCSVNEIDRSFILVYLYTTVVFLLRSNEDLAYQVGSLVDSTLCYFTFRSLIGDMEDFRWFLRALVFLLIPYLALLLVETLTYRNFFVAMYGGFYDVWFREGRVRCIGSFRSPSLLGSLGASFLPLYIGLGFSHAHRQWAITGIALCLGIVWLSNSGGPLGFSVFVVLGWLLWSSRRKMRLVRRVIVIWLIALDLAMKAPIWYLPTHFSFGGDAWHRSYLMDVAMQHLREWWLWGMPMTGTAGWFATQLGTMEQGDITNQFISLGLSAGLMAIVLFIWLLVRAFRSLGRELAAVRLPSVQPSESEYLLWGLGTMLVGHIANFISITYYDQFYVIWLMQLAAISSLTSGCERTGVQETSISFHLLKANLLGPG